MTLRRIFQKSFPEIDYYKKIKRRKISNEREMEKKITKNYLYKLKKDIKTNSVNGGFWRRLKYVGFNYCQ